MCRGCLPARVRLQDKGVQYPTHSVTQDLARVFVDCPFAIQVSQMVGL